MSKELWIASVFSKEVQQVSIPHQAFHVLGNSLE